MRARRTILYHRGDELADQQLLGAWIPQRVHESHELPGLDLRKAGLLRMVAIQLDLYKEK